MILKSTMLWFNFKLRVSGLNSSINLDISFYKIFALWHRTKRCSADSSEVQNTQVGEGVRENLSKCWFILKNVLNNLPA